MKMVIEKREDQAGWVITQDWDEIASSEIVGTKEELIFRVVDHLFNALKKEPADIPGEVKKK